MYLFQNEVMFLLKSSVIYDEPLLTTSIKPRLAGTPRVAAKWRFDCFNLTKIENEQKADDKIVTREFSP